MLFYTSYKEWELRKCYYKKIFVEVLRNRCCCDHLSLVLQVSDAMWTLGWDS